MSRLFIFLFLMFGSMISLGQNISVTFSGTGAVTAIDSVTATNLSTNQCVTLPGSATLLLTGNSGIPEVSLSTAMVSVYPNPFPGQTTIIVNVRYPQLISLNVLNLIGQNITGLKSFVMAGDNEFTLAVNSTGIYLVSITTEQGITGFKVISTGAMASESTIKHNGLTSYNNFYSAISDNPSPVQLKGSQVNYSLSYIPGDIFLFRCISGDYVTIKTDVPSSSVNYEIEFSGCVDLDGRNYSSVTIGEQTWMAENLAYLPEVSPPLDGSDSLPRFYVYNYNGSDISSARNSENYKKYGALYNWDAAMKACPPGWHVPSNEEWRALESYLGEQAGSKLGCISGGVRGKITNSSGFTLVPGGYRNEIGLFRGIGGGAYFWSSSNMSTTPYSANYWSLSYIDNLLLYWNNNNLGNSVRCLKDGISDNTVPKASFTVTPTRGKIETSFQFDASGCSDNETSADELDIRWDFNGDGTWDTAFEKSVRKSFQYSAPGGYSVILEVKDSKGLVNRTSSMIFVGDDTFIDIRDGHEYSYTKIGSQVWMIENLAYLADVSPSSKGSAWYPFSYVQGYQGSSVDEAKSTANYSSYGVLYNWEAAKIACPYGWHLPSDLEWDTLMSKATSDNVMEIGTSHWPYPNSGKNQSGFTALPGGLRHQKGFFQTAEIFQSQSAYFWSVTEQDDRFAWNRSLLAHHSDIYNRSNHKSSGMSVRCVKGINTTAPSANFITTPPRGTPLTSFLFDASACTDRETALTDLVVRWDVNGDDNWDSDYTNSKTFSWQFSAPGDYRVKVEVKDSSGLVDTLTKVLTISDSSFLDIRDGNEYVCQKIGNQIWMAENLAYLPSVDPYDIESETTPLFWVYGYNGNNVDEAKAQPNYGTYGVLYNWPAAMAGDSSSFDVPGRTQGVCPDGWHMPSLKEWVTLEEYLGSGAEKKLKSADGWEDEIGSGDNASGFNALPAGPDFGYQAAFWTSSSSDPTFAWNWSLGRLVLPSYEDSGLIGWYSYRGYRSSVRCMKGSTKLIADFTIDPPVGASSTLFQFDASVSIIKGLPIEDFEVRWDWNSDGTWDTQFEKSKTSSTRYSEPGNYSVTVEVKDSRGLISTLSKLLVVGDGYLNDSRDGQEYVYKTIGTQTWLLENMAYLPSVWPSAAISDTIPYYYVYGFEGSEVLEAKATENFKMIGALYNWTAALTACPDGWHLPRNEEWTVLSDYLGTDAGEKMKTDYWWAYNYQGDNSSGFSALPGGYNHYLAGFDSIRQNANYWSASNFSTAFAWSSSLYIRQPGLLQSYLDKRNGLSVRCLKNGHTMPDASFTISPSAGAISTAFQFDPSDSYDVETSIFELEVRWDWNGDGIWDTDYQKFKKHPHQYQVSGSYTVIMEVKDADGSVDAMTKRLDVNDGFVTDSRDNHQYLYQTIGNQTWMAENLAYLPVVSPSSARSSTEKLYHVYGYKGTNINEAKENENYKAYGALYNWPSALTACPSGWHLPTDAEWTVLIDFLGPTAGNKMKATTGWSIGNGDNSSVFTTLPAGYRNLTGGFSYLGRNAWFWSSSADESSNALYRSLDEYFDGVIRGARSRSYGYSLRCIRD